MVAAMEDLRQVTEHDAGHALYGEEGQGLAEYALILVFIAIVAIAAVTLLGGNVSQLLNSIATKL